MKPKFILKNCSKHGETEYVLEPSSGYYRCKACRSEAVVRRRRLLKKKAVEYLGGECVRCGYKKCNAALEFHHKTDDKEFGISVQGFTRSWERIRKELDKCEILCSNCHREFHEESRSMGESE